MKFIVLQDGKYAINLTHVQLIHRNQLCEIKIHFSNKITVITYEENDKRDLDYERMFRQMGWKDNEEYIK
jgi:hypothetical protein